MWDRKPTSDQKAKLVEAAMKGLKMRQVVSSFVSKCKREQ
jgi:hypothetical protein